MDAGEEASPGLRDVSEPFPLLPTFPLSVVPTASSGGSAVYQLQGALGSTAGTHGWWGSLQPPGEFILARAFCESKLGFFHLPGLLEGKFGAAKGSEFHRYSIPQCFLT